MMDGTRIIKLGPPKEQEIVEIIEVVNLALPMETKAAKGDYELAFGTPAPIATKPVTFEEAFGKHTPEKSGDDNCISVTAPLIETKSNAAGFQAPRPTFNPVASAQAAKASTPVASASVPAANTNITLANNLLTAAKTAATKAKTASDSAKSLYAQANQAKANLPKNPNPNDKATLDAVKKAHSNVALLKSKAKIQEAKAKQQATIAKNAANALKTGNLNANINATATQAARNVKTTYKAPNSPVSNQYSQVITNNAVTPKSINVAQASPAAPGTIPASRFEGESNFSGDDLKKPGLNATKVVLGIALIGIGYIAYKKSK